MAFVIEAFFIELFNYYILQKYFENVRNLLSKMNGYFIKALRIETPVLFFYSHLSEIFPRQ